MKKTQIALILASAFLFSGCDEPVPEQAPTNAAAQEHMAIGTLNSVDQAAGTVNITHAPVPSAGWPEMTMSFKLADPEAAADLKPGGRVDFHFTIESGMNATVTTITPLN